MGQVIQDTDTSKFAPTAQIKVAGAEITGNLLGARDIKTKFGIKKVYRIKVADASCKFFVGKQEVFPEAGSEVEIIPPTRLERQLCQVPVNAMTLIRYIGLGKSSQGNAPHLFHVEVM